MSPPAASADTHLAHLYAISQVFAGLDETARPLDAAVGILARAMKLRCVILLDQHGDHATRTVWGEAGSSRQHRAARAQLSTASRLMFDATAPSVLLEEPGATPLPLLPHSPHRPQFIVLPLGVEAQAPFGTILVERDQQWDLDDVRFLGAAAQQLTLAIDRARHDRARRDDAERQRSLYDEAQKALHARDDILAIVSHDLRNPLATMIMSADLLLDLKPGEAWQREVPLAVARVHRAGQQMERLITDLLDFASIEAGHLAVARKPESPSALIDEALAGLAAVARAAQLVLRSTAPPGLPRIAGDRDRLLQVLGNLISNAIKVTRPPGEITLGAEVDGPFVRFTVTDTGSGIAAGDLGHLFERYWRSPSAPYRGTGLGLAVAAGLVEAHGGHIWADSALGRGSAFHFTVPTVTEELRNRPR